MSYRKKVTRKINKKKIAIKILFPMLIVLNFFLIILQNNNQLKQEKSAIIRMKEMDTALSTIQENASNNINNTYYIAQNGTDTEGTDINNPMSLQQAKKKTFYGNEKILFKRGDTFYGSIDFNIDTEDGKMVYIGNYGEGNKPIISGANILINKNAWEIEGNLYKIDLSVKENFEGIGKITSDVYNIGFLSDEEDNIYGSRKNTKEDLKNQYDFYCEDKYLYLKCESNPSEKMGKIKFCSRNNIVKLSSNMIIDGLDIQNTGAHGMSKKVQNIKNVYIHNCIIQNIGGSVLFPESFTRYGNGLEFYNANVENVLVENNIFRNIYDVGITIQGNEGYARNIEVRDNIFMENTQNIELWNNQLAKGIEQCRYLNNIQINTGKGWGYKVRPDKNVAAEILFYDFKSDLNMEIYNNKSFGARRLYYVKEKNKIKDINAHENKYFLDEQTYLFENSGNYMNKDILNEYKLEEKSIFRLLSKKEQQKISKREILKSNDYNEIKDYYENIEKQIEYAEKLNEIIGKYEQLKEENKLILSKIGNLVLHINDIEINLRELTEELDKQILIEQLEKHYQLGVIILKGNINSDKTEISNINKILNDLNEIGSCYDKILENKEILKEIDIQATKKCIEEAEEVIGNCMDINKEPLKWLELSKQYVREIESYENKNKEYIIGKNLHSIYLSKWAILLGDIQIDEYLRNNLILETYSNKEITNQDVTVTLNIGDDTKITNNNGSNKYTFTENGEYTFEYERRGRNFRQTVKVENIDKQSPKITGVEEGQVYENKIKPIIEDENLETVRLIQDGRMIDNYINNTEIKEEGMYRIEALDKAGNKTIISFEIIENISKEYIIENNIIKNIEANTTVEQFKENIKIQTEYNIQREGQTLEAKEKIETGDILQIGDTQYTLIVRGDIDKDSKITIKDLILLRQQIIGEKTLEDTAKTAGDIDLNKKIDARDIVKLRKLILTNNQ